MCAIRRETILDFADLRFVEIRCKCGGALIADLDSQAGGMTPATCSLCREPFSDEYSRAFGQFREAYRTLRQSRNPSVGFRIPLSE